MSSSASQSSRIFSFISKKPKKRGSKRGVASNSSISSISTFSTLGRVYSYNWCECCGIRTRSGGCSLIHLRIGLSALSGSFGLVVVNVLCLARNACILKRGSRDELFRFSTLQIKTFKLFNFLTFCRTVRYRTKKMHKKTQYLRYTPTRYTRLYSL